MTDFYGALERRAQQERGGLWVGGDMAKQSMPMSSPDFAPAPGLLADEIAELLIGRETRGRHDGFDAGYRLGETETRAAERHHAEHAERQHVAIVLDALLTDLRSHWHRIENLGEALVAAVDAHGAAKTVKDREAVKDAYGQASVSATRYAGQAAELVAGIERLRARVLEEGLPL